jgi:hypothetical protein
MNSVNTHERTIKKNTLNIKDKEQGTGVLIYFYDSNLNCAEEK